jgi:polysaccharide pyruvyl transferase WcaK-like protein
MHIAVYGVIAATPMQTSTVAPFSVRLKRRLKLLRDLLGYRHGGKLACDYRDYAGTHAYNVGDVAIAETIRRLLRKAAPDCIFTNANWGDIESLRSAHRTRKIDLLVVAGSGYFQFDHAGNLARHLREDLDFLAASGIDYAFFGVGINRPFNPESKTGEIRPDDANAQLMRSLLAGARLISVRDAYSAHMLARHTEKDIHLIGDPALHVAAALFSAEPPEKRRNVTIGLNFSFHGPTSNKLLLRNLSAYANALRDIRNKTGCRFRYIVHHGTEYPIPHLLRRHGLEIETIHAGLAVTADAYRDLDLHIGGMLHSCILSASAGTPWIAIAYDIKHSGFNAVMDMTPYHLEASDFDPDKLSDLAVLALETNGSLREKIEARRAALYEDAMRIAVLLTADAT